SRMLSLNFSFQALKKLYISCISAGERGACFPGVLLWMKRYFWLGIGRLLGCPAALSRYPNDARRYPDWTRVLEVFLASISDGLPWTAKDQEAIRRAFRFSGMQACE